MSMPPVDPFPPAYQDAVISAVLNSNVLLAFLMGIYTTIYFGTLYVYLSRKSLRSWIIVFTITMLYVLDIAGLGIQWYLVKWTFINNGESRETVFRAYVDQENEAFWLTLIGDICGYLLSILADGVLIWRCFHIWNRSLRVISLPLFLLLAEIGMYMYSVIVPGIKQSRISINDERIVNRVTCAAFFVSFACTLASTSLIAYRIYPIFGHDSLISRGRFKKILDILIQSAAVYALTMLVQAIAFVIIPLNANTPSTEIVLSVYSSTLFLAISGLAPTLVVARIALTSQEPKISNTPHLSVLRFQGQSTQPTARSRAGVVSVAVVDRWDNVQEDVEKANP